MNVVQKKMDIERVPRHFLLALQNKMDLGQEDQEWVTALRNFLSALAAPWMG